LTTLGVALPAITTLTNKLHRHAITSAHSLNGVRLSLERSPCAQMGGFSPATHYGVDARPGLPCHLRSTLNNFPGKSPYDTASTAPTAYRLPPLRPTAYDLPPTAHVFSSKSPYATASTARTAYHLPPLRPAAYGLPPPAYRSSRLPPTAYRLPPPAGVPVLSGSASVRRPHQISLRPAHRDPGRLLCSRL
jgi:hypothetical protein